MNSSPTPEEVAALYHDVGKCIWHLQYVQYVEDALHTLLALRLEIREPGRVSQTEAEAALAKYRKFVLGNALKAARENNLLPPDLQERFAAFTEERNWLVHRSVSGHGTLMYTTHRRSQIFRRLGAFIDEAKSLQKAIASEFGRFAESQGVSEAEAEAKAHAQIARLRGET